MSPMPAIGKPVEQPVPFSHEHHVQDDGIDCRYCHTSVEKSSFAGMPSTEICMTCHSQIFTEAPVLAPVRASFQERKPLRWKRIHDLPDFVYFNHSIHIHKGIGCVSCHGPVNKMPLTWRAKPLTMEWCLGCHREPERFVRPRKYVFDMDWKPREDQRVLGKRLVEKYNIQSKTDCSTCHR
ncbi:cytochrome c3 family protein [Nitrosococcus wardiae]|nr:cytochrome c3 family protein [Nitrosococcus wardiae]